MTCEMFKSPSFMFVIVALYCSLQLSDSEMASEKFFYFGYGSNLLSKRILINNPSAVRKGVAKLPGYRLDFNGYTERWGGSVATIVPDASAVVWGALWEMNVSDIDNLDRQEGVESGVYEPLSVAVETGMDGGRVAARTYRYVKEAFPSGGAADAGDRAGGLGAVWGALPAERRPSPEYRRVIVLGALETGLPAEYVSALEAIPHNGYAGSSGLGVIPLEEFHRRGPPLASSNDA